MDLYGPDFSHSRDPIFNSRTRIGFLKHLKKACVYISSTILDYGLSVSCFCLAGPFNIFS